MNVQALTRLYFNVWQKTPEGALSAILGCTESFINSGRTFCVHCQENYADHSEFGIGWCVTAPYRWEPGKVTFELGPLLTREETTYIGRRYRYDYTVRVVPL